MLLTFHDIKETGRTVDYVQYYGRVVTVIMLMISIAVTSCSHESIIEAVKTSMTLSDKADATTRISFANSTTGSQKAVSPFISNTFLVTRTRFSPRPRSLSMRTRSPKIHSSSSHNPQTSESKSITE